MCRTCDGERFVNEGEAPCPTCNTGGVMRIDLDQECCFLSTGPTTVWIEDDPYEVELVSMTGSLQLAGCTLPLVMVPPDELAT